MYGAGHAPGAVNRPTGTSDPPGVYQAGRTPLESSGSLTGHILSQGQVDAPPPRSRTVRVIIIILIILIVLGGGGYLIAMFAQDFINDIFSSIPSEDSG